MGELISTQNQHTKFPACVCVLKLLIEGKLLIHFVTQPSVF